MNKILVPGAILLGSLALIKYNAFKEFQQKAEVYIEALNIVPGSFNFKSVKFMLKLKIENPTSFKIELDKIVLQLLINNKPIANIESLQKIAIAPQSFTSFKNEITLDLTKLPGNLLAVITEAIETKNINVQTRGALYSFWGKLNFKQNSVFNFA